jgi:hypothetical protein
LVDSALFSVQILQADDDIQSATQTDPDTEVVLTREQMDRLRKEGNKVSFAEMGKLIGERWKKIDRVRLGRFSELASQVRCESLPRE